MGCMHLCADFRRWRVVMHLRAGWFPGGGALRAAALRATALPPAILTPSLTAAALPSARAGFARRESAERATEETFILPCRGGSLSDAGVVASPTGCGTGMRTMCVLLSKRLRTEGPVEIEVGLRLRVECWS